MNCCGVHFQIEADCVSDLDRDSQRGHSHAWTEPRNNWRIQWQQQLSAAPLRYFVQDLICRLIWNIIFASFLQLDHDLKHAHELRQAAFKLYASLGANDEDIRKKVSLGEGRPPVLAASRQGVASTWKACWRALTVTAYSKAEWLKAELKNEWDPDLGLFAFRNGVAWPCWNDK